MGSAQGGYQAAAAGRIPRSEDMLVWCFCLTGIDPTQAPDGQDVHVDFTPHRSGPLRPAAGLGGYRTPLNGLYLAGAGTHPGGGVMGASGRLAAEAVLKDTKGT